MIIALSDFLFVVLGLKSRGNSVRIIASIVSIMIQFLNERIIFERRKHVLSK